MPMCTYAEAEARLMRCFTDRASIDPDFIYTAKLDDYLSAENIEIVAALDLLPEYGSSRLRHSEARMRRRPTLAAYGIPELLAVIGFCAAVLVLAGGRQ
jgi:hypothetical protein